MLRKILLLGMITVMMFLVAVGCDKENDSNVNLAINTEVKKPPVQGPYTHTIHSATSTDGLNWSTDINEIIIEHASVPTALQFPDGTIRIYYVDASDLSGPERLGCHESKDNGETFQKADCAIEKLNSQKAVDFCIVSLTDGRYRLYYYASGEKTDTPEKHNIDSAISTDGLTFTHEGTVFTYEGLVDPDIFYNGQQWILHSYSITEQATIVATSADGLNFTYNNLLSPAQYAVTKPLALDDGTFRMYGFPQPNTSNFVSFTSADGLDWIKEEGYRLSVDAEYIITDPYVIILNDGSYRMYYKAGKKINNLTK